ncbi:MAG TPA: hypothetical protein VF226_21905, partial [Hyphomicrobiaceae bacterium]
MGIGEKNQVFFDPKGRRGTILKLVTWALGSTAAFISACLAFSVFDTPILPEVKFALQANQLRPAAIFSGPLSDQIAVELGHRRTVPAGISESILRYGFFNHWDESSFASLRENADKLDVLVPEWLHLAGADGDISHDDQRREDHVRLWLKKTARHLKVLPLVNNFDPARGLWDGEGVKALLESPEARAKLTRNLLSYVQDGGFAGIVIDFKSLPDDAVGAYVGFLDELHDAFSAVNLEVGAVLPAYEERFGAEDLSAVTDRIILLAYDDHWEGEAAG